MSAHACCAHPGAHKFGQGTRRESRQRWFPELAIVLQLLAGLHDTGAAV
jgi:hypothetical protein